MTNSIPEKDWKYLHSGEKDLLSELCRTINQKAAAIIHSGSGSEHDKYLLLYKHIKSSDAIISPRDGSLFRCMTATTSS